MNASHRKPSYFRHAAGARQIVDVGLRLSILEKSLCNDVDLANHLALFKLSRDEKDCARLLTTNFDTLFERAWFGEHHSSERSNLLKHWLARRDSNSRPLDS